MGGETKKLMTKNSNHGEKRDDYGYLNISMQHEEHEEEGTLTSIDFVFIEGEGWKLESGD